MDRFGESNTERMPTNTIMPQSREMYLSLWSNVRLEYSRMSAYAGSDNFFNQSVYRDALSSDIKDMFASGLKYGGTTLLSKASRLLTIFDIKKATEDVYNAPPSQAGWVALKEYGAIGFAAYGAGKGEILADPLLDTLGPIIGGGVAIASTVTMASAYASLWMTSADTVHQSVNTFEEGVQKIWSNLP